MKNMAYIIVCAMVLTSCELFVIRADKRANSNVIEIGKHSPIGVVYLFKTELDSSNFNGAIENILNPDGSRLLAYRRYELLPEMSRVKRLMGNKTVTRVSADTLNENSYKVYIQLDFKRNMVFQTDRFNGEWYITSYSDHH